MNAMECKDRNHVTVPARWHSGQMRSLLVHQERRLQRSKVWPVVYYECQLTELLVLTTSELKLGRSINPYDVHQPCKVPPLCYDMSGITKFLARSDVRADLGVGTHSWEQCNRVVEIFLLSDWIKEFKDAVSTVLSQDRRGMG